MSMIGPVQSRCHEGSPVDPLAGWGMGRGRNRRGMGRGEKEKREGGK